MKLSTIWSAYEKAWMKAEHALKGRNTVMSPIQACELNALYRKRMRQYTRFAGWLNSYYTEADKEKSDG